MKFRSVALALALTAMTAAPVAAQEMQPAMPAASDDDAPVEEAAALVPPEAAGSTPVETAEAAAMAPEAAPVETAAAEPAPVAPAMAEVIPVATAQADPASAPAPAAKRTFMDKATIAAGTFAAAYAAFEAMKAATKKKPVASPTTE